MRKGVYTTAVGRFYYFYPLLLAIRNNNELIKALFKSLTSASPSRELSISLALSGGSLKLSEIVYLSFK